MCLLQLRAYCGSLSQDTQAECTAVLIAQLGDWAVGAGQVHDVIRLPLTGLEEQVRVFQTLKKFFETFFVLKMKSDIEMS